MILTCFQSGFGHAAGIGKKQIINKARRLEMSNQISNFNFGFLANISEASDMALYYVLPYFESLCLVCWQP